MPPGWPDRAGQLDTRGIHREHVQDRRRPRPAARRCLLAAGLGHRRPLDELLGSGAKVEITRRHFIFRYRSAADFFETFKTYYGPTLKAWEALDDDGRASFQSQLIALAEQADRGDGTALAVPSEYVEVVATRT